MPRIEFQLQTLPLHPSMAAQLYAVIHPITGSVTDYKQQIIERLQVIQEAWRSRLPALRDAGCEQLQTERLAYIRNCPPSTCAYSPKTQSCNLRICPYCHARRVSNIYGRLRELLRANPGAKVASWRKYTGHEDDASRIYFDADMGLNKTFLRDVYPQQKEFRHVFQQENMTSAIGGVYWYSITPYTYKRIAADGSEGRWNTLHGCCAVMPPDWKSWKSDDLRVVRQPDDYQLAWLVGRCFQYRQQWLLSDPDIMSAFLNATRGDVFLSAFGRLAPNAKSK